MSRTPKQNLEYLAKWAERNAVVDDDNSTGLTDFDYGYATAASWVRDILNDAVTFESEALR
jgi:hypothetical protein